MTTTRLKRVGIGVALYFSAVALGLGSAWWVLKKAPWMQSQIQVGAWKGNMLAGSPDADMYTRASVAVNALLALGRDETMYFIATTDDQGKPLRSHCTYRVEGTAPLARWWSVTAYADDMFLFDVPSQKYSVNGNTIALDASKRFSFQTGPIQPQGIAWLPTVGQRGLVLTLRLYNPEPSLQAAPATLQAPTITSVGGCA